MNRNYVRLLLVLCLALASVAFGRVAFELQGLNVADLRDVEKLEQLCGDTSDSFWCRLEGQELALITTKSADYLFDDAGELVALYAKPQKGQDFDGAYNLEHGQNLIPYTASVPGAAVLVDGDYVVPENVSGGWERRNADEFVGSFSYELDGLQVDKTVVVSSISHTLEFEVEVSRAAAAEESSQIQLAFPGIARADNPVVKIGQADTSTTNPISQPVSDPSYISLQTSQSRGNALVLRPSAEAEGDAAALYIQPNIISLSETLAPEAGSSVSIEAELYGGPNELVRYHQEGYLDLPGLFNPNLLGQLSLGLLAVLETIHDFTGNWGLAVIVLTVLFRILVWPLMTTQTKSMVGMQQLQPKLQALQKKYKDNKEKLQQETMKLYQEAGVNPAGGCLPILVQMPLFIILWRVFANYEFNEGFLWIPDLGLSDPFYILPILYVGVMIGNSLLLARGNPQSLRQQILINVVFVFFIINIPAGVTLYWVVSMLIQMGQQFLIQRKLPAPAKAA